MAAIPLDSTQLTRDWLNQALTESGVLKDGMRVDHVSVEPVGEDLGYLSYLYRLRPAYSADDGDLPATMVAKLPSTEEANRLTGNSLRAYERESLFYQHYSQDSPCAPPARYYSYSDPSADAYVLLMEDLGHCRFVNQVDGVQPEDARACLRAMARHHARYWEKTNELDWLPPFSDFGQLYQSLLGSGARLIQENWANSLLPAYTDHVDLALERYADVAAALQRLPTTLIHCDPRIENIAFDGDTPRFYDWQLTSRGPAAYDLMYFFKQSMDVNLRRECQDALFDAYLETLAENGVEYDKGQLMEDVALACCTIWGFVAMIGNFFFRNEVNDKIWGITQPRFMGMIDDFGAAGKLREL